MTTTHKLVRGSNTGIYAHGLFQTLYNEACPRIVVLRGRGVQAHEADNTGGVFELGRQFEQYFKTKITEEYEEEKVVEFEITDNLMFQGHCDLYIKETGFVYELKSLTSKNSYRDVFKKGKPKLSNLFQLVAYMAGLDQQRGALAYGSYLNVVEYMQLREMSAEEIVEKIQGFEPELRTFQVTIDAESLDILVDGKPTTYNVAQMYDFWNQIAEHHKTGQLPSKPIGYNGKGNPCYFCPFNFACLNSYANIEDFENYLLTNNLASAKLTTPE